MQGAHRLSTDTSCSACTRRSFDSCDGGGDAPPLKKRPRRATARALESAQLEAMDVFGEKEDEEDR